MGSGNVVGQLLVGGVREHGGCRGQLLELLGCHGGELSGEQRCDVASVGPAHGGLGREEVPDVGESLWSCSAAFWRSRSHWGCSGDVVVTSPCPWRWRSQ